MQTYKVLIAVIGFAAIGLGVFEVSRVNASWFPAKDSSFITSLANKLGVSEDKVKEALGTIQSDRQKEMQRKLEERLNQYVTEGKITEVQKQLIIKKHEDLRNNKQENLEQFKNMTPQDRKEAMEKKRTELETWAKQNGIDLSIFGGIGFGHKFGGIRGFLKMK